jgi:hypothetical protein
MFKGKKVGGMLPVDKKETLYDNRFRIRIIIVNQ